MLIVILVLPRQAWRLKPLADFDGC